jgi:nickel/cobalt transporter (NicO) family protein
MTRKLRRYSFLALLSACCFWLFWLATTTPSQAHWSDLSTAEIKVQAEQGHSEAQIALTYPTKLTAFADDDASGQLSEAEINRHRNQLQAFLQARIQLKDSQNQLATLSMIPSSSGVSSSKGASPSTHTALQLTYAWPAVVQGIEIDYNLFIANAPEASCLATISQAGQFTSHVFKPQETTLALTPAGNLFSSGLGSGKWALTLIGVFAWGAAHSMSPGHGKTLVGAYLVGERATPRHAIFLAMITTVTHTIGVFALGLVTLFAARYVLPEQLYPWLSLLSGSMVVAIGANMLWQRISLSKKRAHSKRVFKETVSHKDHEHSHAQSHEHIHTDDHHHAHGYDHLHDHSDSHSHEHSHGEHSHVHDEHSHGEHSHVHEEHSHGKHSHSHLPALEDQPVTFQSLLLLGVSAGLVPCPAALVLLLGAIALGNPLSGLILVVVFSLGLSLILTALGLSLVYAKQLFQKLQMPQSAWVRWLPVASAAGIVVIGIGISAQSLQQVF